MKKKQQKMKKAAQLAANISAEAAALQEKIGEGKGAIGAEGAKGVASGSKPELGPAFRKKLKKVINLVDKLPNSVVIPPKAQKCDEEEDGSTETDDEAPDLVNPDDASKFGNPSDYGQMGLTSLHDNPKWSRAEKKARRLLMKLDLKPIKDVYRVTMKKSKNIMLIIESPDVYKSPTGTFIIFGKVLVEDMTNTAATQAAERYRELEAFKDKGADKAAATDAAGAAAVDDDDDGDDMDEAAAKDLDEKDIELVQMQASCSRKKAIKALLLNGHDVVNAIMDLTMG
ncbi:hypothetical protein KR054_008622 [Drosophila jambulina]|nr:hypothetical protein KR054_008622 [Drosophila jambulina]